MAAEEVIYILTLKDLFTSVLKGAHGEVNEFEASLKDLQKGIAEAFAVEKVVEFGKEILHTTMEFEGFDNRIKFSSLGDQDAAKNIEYLHKVIGDLSLPMRTTYEGFSEMQAGLIGTGIEGEKLRGLFTGLSTAASVLHLSTSNLQRTLYDFKEIGEIGLNGRIERSLGTAFPGINQIAREQFGMTMKELQEHGVSGAKFLEGIGDGLQKHFAGGVANWNNSLQAMSNKTENSFIELQIKMGQDLEDFYKGMMKGVISVTESLKETWTWSVKATEQIKDWAKENKTGIDMVAGAVTAGAVAWAAYTMWTGRAAIASGFTTALTVIETGIMYALGTAVEFVNAMFLASPIGWVVGGMMLIGAAVMYAWHTWEGFRGFLEGTWEWLKTFGTLIGEFFHGLGQAISNIFNPTKAKEGIDEMTRVFHDGGARLGEAYERGFNKGRNDFRLEKIDEGTPSTVKKLGEGKKADRAASTPPQTEKEVKAKGTGQKIMNINIQIGSLVKDLQIKTTNIQNGAGELRAMIAEALLDAVNDSQIIAAN